VTEWSVAFNCAALGFAESAELRRQLRRAYRPPARREGAFRVARRGDGGRLCRLQRDLPDRVQLGGVWTPPALRGRGYARAVVAGALLAARVAGVERAVLFTENDNQAALAAYRSLGFSKIGVYGIVIFP